MGEPLGPDEVGKIAIQQRGMVEQVSWAWSTVCAFVGHDFRNVPGHSYILRCER